MISTIQNTSTLQRPSALEVLWAFYQSQPIRVKKAFRTRMEAEEKGLVFVLQWQIDLKEIKALKDNWDEEGAKPANRVAIRKVQQLMGKLSSAVAVNVRLFPTPLGAVMLKKETAKGRIKGEIGDTQMSYFVKYYGAATEYHSFEDLNKGTLGLLVANMERILWMSYFTV